MRNIIEKFIIISLSAYSFYILDTNINPVPYILLFIAISILLDLLKNKNQILIIYIIAIGLCIYKEIFLFFTPVILYNLYKDNKNFAMIITLMLFQLNTPLNFLVGLLSIYLSHQRLEFNRMVIENKAVRDNLKEDTISLQSYNQQLIREREKDIEIAILKERNRISKELHDSVGHLVSSSILQVEALEMVAENENSKIVPGLEKLQDRLTTGMKDIRESIHNLHSESLDLEKQILKTIEEYPNLKIELNYNIRENINYELKFDILSIIKETIINSSKHSNGDSMKINLLEQPKFFSISIKDNGEITENKINKSGIGLITIEELAEKYNGFVNYHLEKGFGLHIALMKGK